MTRPLIAGVAIFACAGCASEWRGDVTDMVTKVPIAGARISEFSLSDPAPVFTTTTDANGRFQVKSVSGPSVSVFAQGYFPQPHLTLEVPPGRRFKHIAIYMVHR